MKIETMTKYLSLPLMLIAAALVGCDAGREVSVEGAPDLSEVVAPDVEMPSPSAPGSTADEGEVRSVSVKIDTMNCVEGCFNGIQAVLKKRAGVVDVTLAPQKDTEGLIDNSMITISYRGELDRANIEKTILGAGFDGVEFIDEPKTTASSSTEEPKQ